MKKTIVLGTILTVFLMLMMPAISAIEFSTIEEANKEYIKKEIEKIKDMPTLFRGTFTKLLGKIISAVALPIVFAILTIFGTALTAVTTSVLPLLNLMVKIISLVYGNILGITTNAFRALLVIAILLLF